MATNDYPILDGVTPSWADIVVRATPYGGSLIETKDIAAINTSRSVEVGEQRGTSGGIVTKRTTGAASQEASWTLYYSGYHQLMRALVDLAPQRGNQYRISLVHFDIQMQWTPYGADDIFERRLQGVRVVGDTINPAEGTEAQQVEVPLSVIRIVDVIDGKEIVLL